jgi:O-antigen/teichoic acid export membrane protein
MMFSPDNTAAIQESKEADEFVASAGHKRIETRAFIGTGATSVFIVVCAVVQGFMEARILGPTGRGELAAAILWPSVFAGIGLFGIDTAISRVSAKKHNQEAITRTGILLALCTATVTTAACYLLLPRLLPQSSAHLLPVANVFLLYIFLNHLALNLIAVDQGTGNFKRFNFSRMILYPAYLLLVVVIWATGMRSVFWFAIATLLANATVVIFRLYLAPRNSRLIGPLFPAAQICKEGLRFGLAKMINTFYEYADKTLLLWLLEVRELGLYMVALTASGVVNSLASSSGMVIFTIAAQETHRSGFERIAQVFRTVVLLWVFLGGLLALTIPNLLPLVYGREFVAAVNPAILLIPGSALKGLSSLLEQTMRGQGRPFVGVEGRLAGLAAMVPIAYFASKAWGMNGICLAFSAGQLANFAVLVVHTKYHYRQISLFKSLVPTLKDVRELAKRGMNWLRTSQPSKY